MPRWRKTPRHALSVLVCTTMAVTLAAGHAERGVVAERVRALTRDSVWTRVAAVPIGFDAYHPQGMVKVGDTLFVSSVEITVPTRRFAQSTGGLDRDPGEGKGHLFKLDLDGRLIGALELGEGTVYHPGGIDYDGKHIWIPVAEYRPNSRSIVYRVDPYSMRATEVFRFGDHLGAIVHNVDDRTLHGVSWGSRRFYRWTLDGGGRVTHGGTPPERLATLNPSHYIDYQDCTYAGRRRMLCTGVTELRRTPDATSFKLGGIELVDLADGRPLHQVPVPLWTPTGHAMTRNPVWLEPSATGLRAYFLPEDNRGTLYIYDVELSSTGAR